MTLSQFGCEQIRQLDLSDLAFDLRNGHRCVQVMQEARFRQQLHKQFLGEIGVGTAGALFNQQACAARSSHQRMITYNSMQFGP